MKQLIINLLLVAFVSLFAVACTQTGTTGTSKDLAPVVADVDVPDGYTIWTKAQVMEGFVGKTKDTGGSVFKHYNYGRMSGTVGTRSISNGHWSVAKDGKVNEGRGKSIYYVVEDAEGRLFKMTEGKIGYEFTLR